MTLDDGQTTIELPDSLEWVNEFEYSSIQQDKQYTLGDNLVVSENKVTKGRPINLVGGEQVWVSRLTVLNLLTLTEEVDKTFTLTLPDARTLSVKLNRETTAIIAKPVWRQNIHDNDASYTLSLNLMEV